MIMKTIRRAWNIWKQVGRLIGDFIGRVVLTIFYFTVFVPFGLGVRFFADPLGIERSGNPSHWLERETRDRAISDAQKQF